METTTETTTTWHVSFSTSIYIVGDNYILLVLIIKIIIIIRIMMIMVIIIIAIYGYLRLEI